MLQLEQIKEILAKGNILPPANFDKIAKEASSLSKNVEDYLAEKKIISTAGLYEKASEFFDLPFINLKDQNIRKDVLLTIPEPIASTHELIAFDSNTESISLAVLNPSDLEIFEFIKKKTGLEIKLSLTTPESIQYGLKQYHKSLEAEFDSLEDAVGQEPSGDEDLKKLATNLPVVRVVDTLLEYAIFEDASDIHIEPEEKEVNVRYRIDGVLRHVMTLPKNIQSGITARIKILANLKVDEHRLPQDGRFKISNREHKVSFRVSIIPTFDGEKIVMRLLREKAQVLTLEQLGFQSSALQAIKRNMTKPHGLLLVT
ncbi:Flp pilus assembly complex ATPase component TadA, partial [Candidatus Falkowbacteria bacterium]|nr:Flp pilus assembly complex ATPase component TadA [Candidatus Falkowbacteria bacterium]